MEIFPRMNSDDIFHCCRSESAAHFFPTQPRKAEQRRSRDGQRTEIMASTVQNKWKKKKLFSERNPEQRACLCLHMHTGYLSCMVFRITTAGLRAALAPLLHGTLPGCIWSSSGPVGCVWTSTKASSTRATDNMATLKKLTAAVVAYVTEWWEYIALLGTISVGWVIARVVFVRASVIRCGLAE